MIMEIAIASSRGASLESWDGFLGPVLGAVAALLGFIIVALSVNSDLVIKMPTMPSRVAATLATMVVAAVISAVGLMPDIDIQTLGWVLLIASVFATVFHFESALRLFRSDSGRSGRQAFMTILVATLPLLIFYIASILAITDHISAMTWIGIGILIAFVTSVLITWVVLIEIRR